MVVRNSLVVLLALGIPLSACTGGNIRGGDRVQVEVNNPLQISRVDQMVELAGQELEAIVPGEDLSDFVVEGNDGEICSQVVDRDEDGKADTLLFATDLAAGEKRTFSLRVAGEHGAQKQCKLRAHAELSQRVGGRIEGSRYVGGRFEPVDFHRAPENHRPQDMLYKFEGPGWESDKVAYRLYFDSRNTTDIFGKTTEEVVLPEVGVQEDNYHQMLDWGMDILKVGKSLGIGAIGMQLADGVHKVEEVRESSARVVERGPLRAHVQMQYTDWQLEDARYQLQSDFSIDAGSRLTRHAIKISGQPQNLVTGIVRHPAANVVRSPKSDAGWGYLATYGDQSYINDGLGMAVFFRNQNLIELSDDAHSELVVMRPQGGELEYYFLAAWVQEPGGIRDEREFKVYLDEVLAELNNPVQIKISRGENG